MLPPIVWQSVVELHLIHGVWGELRLLMLLLLCRCKGLELGAVALWRHTDLLALGLLLRLNRRMVVHVVLILASHLLLLLLKQQLLLIDLGLLLFLFTCWLHILRRYLPTLQQLTNDL